MAQPINLLNLCENLFVGWTLEEDLRVNVDCLRKFAERNGLEIIKRNFNGTFKYRAIRKNIATHYISGELEKSFSFLDIADIHIGSKYFDEELLRDVLEEAVRRKVNQVFIAGDIFEGFNSSDEGNAIYLKAIDTAIKIFGDYNLNYYAICGNHDYSFEQIWLPNPLKRTAAILKENDVNFNYYDQYLVDFIICGVGKRVMHAERQDYNKQNIFQVEKLNFFERRGYLNCIYLNQEYPLRFFQVGHIHHNLQMYYSAKKINISQSGSFLTKDNLTKRANFISGKIENSKVFLNNE